MTIRRQWYPVGAAVVLLAGTAWAHPKVLRSFPASNATVARPPTAVRVWFDEEVDPRGSRLTVWGQDREPVHAGNSKVSLDDRRLIEVGLKPLAPGRYTVRWRAMADEDKGVTQGEFTFRMAAAR